MPQPPVLMIHGIGSSHQNNFRRAGWQDILEETGRTVHPIELPGHGLNRGDEGPVAEVAASIIDAARRYGSVDAIGFSAGGYALLVAASREPELFCVVALLGVADGGMLENRGTGGSGMQEIADALLAEEEPPHGMTRMLRRLTDAAGNDRAAVARYALSDQPAPSLAALARVQARSLVVEGSADLTGPAAGVAAALRAQHVVVKGADHFSLPSDVRCIDAVLTFLDDETVTA